MEVLLLQFPGAVFKSLLSKVVDNNPTNNEICLFRRVSSSFRFEETQRGKVNTRAKELLHGSASSLASLPCFLTILAGQRNFAGPLILPIPKCIQSCRHPSGLCFPSCFCRVLISFGCVNLLGPLNQHHPVGIVSAHLVTLALRESTL